MADVEQFEVVVTAGGMAPWYSSFFDADQSFTKQGALPYDERAKVSIVAGGDTTLGEVIDQAAEQFNVRSKGGDSVATAIPAIAFYRPRKTAEQTESTGWYEAFRTLDAAGDPSWAVRWSEIRLDELLAVRAANDLDGDPLRPYLHLFVPQGVATDLASALQWTWMLWSQALAGLDTIRLAREVLKRIKGGQDAARMEPRKWIYALRRPQDLIPYLDDDPRTTAEIVSYTGLSQDQEKGELM